MSDVIDSIPTESLQFNDAPSLIWVRVRDANRLLWSDNPKLHDIGSVTESIRIHGFQELAKFDKNLPNVSGGVGAIKAGNGRIETLDWMERAGNYELPRGLALGEDDEGQFWALPLLIGTDAVSLELAEAYALDSNNLTMIGGEFSPFEIARMWDPDKYLEILGRLQEKETMPASVTGDDLRFLMAAGEQFSMLEEIGDIDGEKLLEKGSLLFKVRVMELESFEAVIDAVRQVLDDNPEWRASIE